MFYLSIVGFVAAVGQFLGVIVATATAGGSPTLNIGFGFTASAAAIVVGIMAWIVRKVVSGEVVPLPIHELVEKQQREIDLLVIRAEKAEADAADAKALLQRNVESLGLVNDFLRRAPRT